MLTLLHPTFVSPYFCVPHKGFKESYLLRCAVELPVSPSLDVRLESSALLHKDRVGYHDGAVGASIMRGIEAAQALTPAAVALFEYHPQRRLWQNRGLGSGGGPGGGPASAGAA